MLCFRKENTRPATSSRDRKSAGEKLKPGGNHHLKMLTRMKKSTGIQVLWLKSRPKCLFWRELGLRAENAN